MAGTKVASIKLTLDKSGFTGGLKASEAEARGVAQRMGAAFKTSLSDGLAGGKKAIGDLFSTIKSSVATLGGLAGGIGIIDLARDAVVGTAAFRHLADSVKRGSGELVDFRRLQEEARQSATRWAQDTDKLGAAMAGMFDETGDIDFARQAIDAVAATARASGKSVEHLGQIAGTLNEKFGIAGEDIGEALASVLELTSKGGISVEDMASRLGLMGAAAKEAGLTGEDGFRRMAALMNIADDATGNLRKGISGVSGLLETLGQKKSMTKVAQTLGIDATSLGKADVEGRIEQILKKTGGKKEKLEAVFGGEQLEIMTDLGKKYAAAYEGTAGDMKTKAAAGVAAVREAFDEASKSTTTFADVQADAAREMQSTEARMQTALNKLRDVFLREDIQAAIGKLAENLPKLADAVASVATWAVDNPTKAGIGAVAAVGANGAISATFSSLIGAAFAKGGTQAAATIATGIAGAAPAAGTSMAGSIASAAGPIGLAIAAAIAVAAITTALDSENRAAAKKDVERQVAEVEETGESFDPKTGKFIRKTRSLYASAREARGEDPNDYTEHDVSLGRKGIAGMADRLIAGQDRADVDAELDAQEAAYWSKKPKAEGGGGGFNKQDQMLLAEMIAAKRLRVEVVNFDQMKAGPGGGGGPATPVPGKYPR